MNENTSANSGGPRHAVLRFAPGAGLAITRGTLFRAINTYGTGRVEIQYRRSDLSGIERTLNPTGNLDSVSGNSGQGNPAVPLWPANRFDFPVNDGKGNLTPPAPSEGLDLVVSCGPPAPCGGASGQIFRSDLVLNDPSGPVVDLVGGTIVEQGQLAARVLKGNESITIAASDVGVGVDRLRVEIDGQQVAEGLLRGAGGTTCRWDSPSDDGLPATSFVRPCPPSGSGTVVLDTTKFIDGSHELRVVALDGAGGATVVVQGRVLVRNTSVVGPGSPLEFRGAANGNTTSEQAAISAGWLATSKAPSKNKKTIRRCKKPSYRKANLVRCDGRAASDKYVTGWSRSKSATIVGSLRDANSQPIADATVDMVAVTEGTPRVLGTIQTDASGVFTGLVPRSTSQAISLSWRARVNDTQAATAFGLSLKVKVVSSFRTANLRAGRSAKFSGRVGGDALGSGASVRLQWRTGNTWATFDTAVADKNGRWTIRRKLTQRTTYRMRVLVEDSARGLYDGTTSSARRVSIR